MVLLYISRTRFWNPIILKKKNPLLSIHDREIEMIKENHKPYKIQSSDLLELDSI